MRFYSLLFIGAILLLFLAHQASSQAQYDRSRLTDFFQSNDYQGAISWLRSMGDRANDLQYQSDLGYASFMNEDFATAKAVFLAVFRQKPVHLQANVYLAQLYEEAGQPDSALLHYQQLTALRPNNYRYWYRSAQLLSNMGSFEAALLCVQKGYELNPRAGKLAVQYASLLVRLKQVPQADSLIDAFLRIDSSNQDVIIKKIDLASKKPEHAQVIHWGEKLLADSADVTIPYVSLAYSYLNTDSTGKCIWLCEWLMGKNKANPPVFYCAALAYGKRKDFLRSNEYLDKCLELSLQKEAVTYFNAKADNYEEMKQYRKSASYYDTSYYLFKSPPDLYYAGRIYDKYLNSKQKASSYYRQFVEKRKRPLTNEEARIFQYIEAFLKEPVDGRKKKSAQ